MQDTRSRGTEKLVWSIGGILDTRIRISIDMKKSYAARLAIMNKCWVNGGEDCRARHGEQED